METTIVSGKDPCPFTVLMVARMSLSQHQAVLCFWQGVIYAKDCRILIDLACPSRTKLPEIPRSGAVRVIQNC